MAPSELDAVVVCERHPPMCEPHPVPETTVGEEYLRATDAEQHAKHAGIVPTEVCFTATCQNELGACAIVRSNANILSNSTFRGH
jgi:hypothetical protein